MTTEKFSVETLRDYLLGRLPAADAERLDELSITDETCAGQISAVEHDLVDAYVRGELRGTDLETFRSTYLATLRGREAIQFAEALQAHEERPAQNGVSGGQGPAPLISEKGPWRSWLAAAATIALVSSSVWLALDNRALRARVAGVETSRDELQRDRQLRDAEAAQPANIAPVPDGRGPSALPVATLVLVPPVRSAQQLPAVALTDGAPELSVRLDLEPVDYPIYSAVLVASSADRELWRADRLTARTAGDRQHIDLRVPAAVLVPQDYLIRIHGVPARGAAEIVGEYRFTVVR